MGRTRTRVLAVVGVLAFACSLWAADAGPKAGREPPGGSIGDLLRAIPAGFMPRGNMTPALEKAFRAWATSKLAGKPAVAEFVVNSVEGAAGEATVVTGYVPVANPVHGRSTLCKVRASLSDAGGGVPDIRPGRRVALAGQLAARDSLYPEHGRLGQGDSAREVAGWTADRAYFGVNLVSARAPTAQPDRPSPGEAPTVAPKPSPAAPAKDEAKPPPAEKKPKPDATEFFKLGAGAAGRIVYVIDRSGSMTDSIDYVKYEAKRSIGELAPGTAFTVIFFSTGPPVEMFERVPRLIERGKVTAWGQRPPKDLFKATEANKRAAYEFIDGVTPQGETDPSKALARAFQLKPELIYLLTDGEFDRANIDLVKRENADGKVVVHTIGFLYRTGEPVLKKIAAENNGCYKFVSEADLPTLAD